MIKTARTYSWTNGSNGTKQSSSNAKLIFSQLSAEISSRSRKPRRKLEPPMDSIHYLPKIEKHLKLAVKKPVHLPKPLLLPPLSLTTHQQLVKKDQTAELDQTNVQLRLIAAVLPLQRAMQLVWPQIKLKLSAPLNLLENILILSVENTNTNVMEPRHFLPQPLPSLLPFYLCEYEIW